MNNNKILIILLSFCITHNLFTVQTKKIIALLQIRNEQEVVEQCLRMLAMYADGIVVLDDASDDATVACVQSLVGELPIEEIIMNQVSAWQNGSEKDNREKLLLAGRRAGGTHFIMLDADEMFSARCLEQDWMRTKILSLKPGQTLRVPTIHQWNDLYLYRNDEQCNPTMDKWRRVYAFADDGVCSYNDNQSWHGSVSIHVSREPEKMICNEPIKSFYFNRVECGVLHFKCVSLQNIDIKKAWYMCLELMRLNESAVSQEARVANAQHINKVYNEYLYSGILSHVTGINCASIPAEWYAYDFFDGNAYTKPFTQKIDELRKWFGKYGPRYFAHLDIWTIQAVQDLRQEAIFADDFLTEQYQDIIINNQVIKPGVRECAHRYEALKTILDQYQRPITVLDIGASQGYFSFRIAYDYDATCVMVEGDYNDSWRVTEQLLELCRLNTDLDTIVFLRHRITPDDLVRLATCEHFDVVLAFNIVHHLGSDWQKATDALLKLGDNIVIETPPSNDLFADNHPTIKKIEEYLIAQNGTVICETPRHTDPTVMGKMFWFEREKTHLQRTHWFVKKLYEPYYPNITITSNFLEKTITKTEPNSTYAWHKGINLLTFKMLNGAYPEPEAINNSMKQVFDRYHPDFFPWNMILQGKNSLALIDVDDMRWPIDAQAAFEFSLRMMSNMGPRETLSWFLENWIPFNDAANRENQYLSWCIGSKREDVKNDYLSR